MSQPYHYQSSAPYGQPGAAAGGQSSFGLSPNAAALLTYLFVPLTSILMLVTEKENKLVRFHAWQSIFYGLSISAMSIILSIAVTVLGLAFSAVSPTAGVVVMMGSLLVWMGLLVAIIIMWVLCIYKAWRGEFFTVPVVGGLARRMAGV